MGAAKPRPLPKVGKTFEAVYKGTTFRMQVVKDAKGVAYEVDGKIFPTPSAAGRLVN